LTTKPLSVKIFNGKLICNRRDHTNFVRLE
jgi:hypothetical protein